jgi:hypothetical protein
MKTWLAVLLAMTSLLNAQMPESDGGSTSQSEQKKLEAWMRSSGMAPQFKIVRIGLGPHPDVGLADADDIHHLELLFVPQSSVEAQEVARFETFLRAYEEKHGTTLAEKTFYEFTERFHFGRRQACVDFHVMETEYSVFVKPTSSELTVVQLPTRDLPRHFTVSLPGSVPSAMAANEKFGVTAGRKRPWSAVDIREYLHHQFDAYFLDINQHMGLQKPEIVAEADDAYPGYLGLTVQGVRGLVTKQYWERMRLNIEFHADDAPDRGQQMLWKFSCSLGVKYASSIHEESPQDADPAYLADLLKFRDKLIEYIQQSLAKGNHD